MVKGLTRRSPTGSTKSNLNHSQTPRHGWILEPALPERSFKPTVINTFIHIEILVFLRMLQSTS